MLKMSIQIFPESVETLECVICYDSRVELNEVCHNKHKLCKNCITRIKNKKCPFCRTNIVYVVGDIESLEQEQQQQSNDDRYIEVVVPEYIQQQTRSCICITKMIQVVSLITIFIIFVVNYDTYSQTEIALFIIIIMLFSFSLFFSIYYRIRIL